MVGIAALLSPVIMTAIAWGSYKARLRSLELRTDRLEGAVFKARSV